MKRIIKISATAFFAALTLSSCNDWLDVRGENIQKEADQFDNYKGFRDALTGCYMTMGSEDIYGEKLTMTDIESMADMWYLTYNEETSNPLKYYLSKHKYTEDEPRAAIKTIYGTLFTTISSANVLLKNLEEKGSNIGDTQARNVIEGEALAIRAYCQFDILRLFGQMPKGATKQVSLPYSYTTSIDEMPAYYSFDGYVANLESDIARAEALLKEYDPVMTSTFTTLNNPGSTVDDDYMYYRQARLNYWAVRALHARMELYLGNNTEAHSIATEIINAKNSDGSSVVSLSGITDLQKGYNGLPSECLFYISKYDLNDYANDLLIGGRSAQAGTSKYYVSSDMLTELFASVPGSTASHNRYLSEWNRTTKNSSNSVCPSLKKYWYDEDNASSSDLSTKYQIVPMIRLSEMYLIAMETSTSLDEVLTLYKTYMTDREFVLYTPFASLEEVKAEIPNEYRRELFGEGQMFFTYKRLGSKEMMWGDGEMTESDYILPLPSSEYDPSIIK